MLGSADKPIDITCPWCFSSIAVYHMEWVSIECSSCNRDINKREWIILKPVDSEGE